MDNERNFLFALGALASVRRLVADPLRTAGSIALPPPFSKQRATSSRSIAPLAQRSTAHKHPGFVLGYVLEGEFRFQMAGQAERILRAGDTFYEPPGGTHLVAEGANANRPARVLAIVIAEQSSPLVESA